MADLAELLPLPTGRLDPWTLPPLGMLMELTHRCPLQCPYCSNPLELERVAGELDTATWCRVLREAAALGVLQLHLSGGEPLVRRDLEAIVRAAREQGLYTNLITSGVLLDAARLDSLVTAGLDHVQLSLQGASSGVADRFAGYRDGHVKKLAAARLVRAAGLPLTINAVVHRQNLDELELLIELAVDLGAMRIEVAHVQYYGWALANRAALMPTAEQLERSKLIVAAARQRHAGRLLIDFVVPDYYAKRPKPCMGGWGRALLNVTPGGRVMPCHAAASIKGLAFPDVQAHSLAWIWQQSPAFQAFRGTDWLAEPCRSCALREVDFGGCRCQAMALTGDPRATDPACELSPLHGRLGRIAGHESAQARPDFVYRRPMAVPPEERRAELAPS